MTHTYKVLAMIIYRDEKKVVTTNVIKAENKIEAKKKAVQRYIKSPNVAEILINEETDVIQLM